MVFIIIWLVVDFNPSGKWWTTRQLGVWNSPYMESHKSHVPNHPPEMDDFPYQYGFGMRNMDYIIWYINIYSYISGNNPYFFDMLPTPLKETQLPSMTGTPFIWRKGFTHHKENCTFPKVSPTPERINIQTFWMTCFGLGWRGGVPRKTHQKPTRKKQSFGRLSNAFFF